MKLFHLKAWCRPAAAAHDVALATTLATALMLAACGGSDSHDPS